MNEEQMIKIKIYEAKTPADRDKLRTLTDGDMKKDGFPSEVKVFLSDTESSLVVATIEPMDVPWDWGPAFDPFTILKRIFELKPHTAE